jgi:hypothetical protein
MRDAIIQILTAGTGCGIECLGVLFVYQLENGKFSVVFEEPESHPFEEWDFDTAEEAADYFLKERERRQLGFDFET